jgi:uncharacterized membrane protein
MHIALHLLIILMGLSGFFLAFYIYHHKRKPEITPLVCPIGHNCDAVVHSDYSRFIGIPVEILGLIYYCVVVAVYTLFLAFPFLSSPEMSVTLFGISAVAFIFSMYLVGVQSFILKQWCTWCLISAMICSIIFVILLSGFFPL